MRFTNWVRIIVRSCRSAGLRIFTNSVWFLMNFSPVYLPTVVPVTVAGIARNAGADHFFPSVDGASLQQRRLQSFASQIHIKQVADRLHVTSEHTRLFISRLVSYNLATLNIEQLIVVANAVENAVEMLAVGVGNENLSESVARHELYDLLHTM